MRIVTQALATGSHATVVHCVFAGRDAVAGGVTISMSHEPFLVVDSERCSCATLSSRCRAEHFRLGYRHA